MGLGSTRPTSERGRLQIGTARENAPTQRTETPPSTSEVRGPQSQQGPPPDTQTTVRPQTFTTPEDTSLSLPATQDGLDRAPRGEGGPGMLGLQRRRGIRPGQRVDSEFQRTITNSPNFERATATHESLKALQGSDTSGRITDELIRTLTLGVAEPRSDSTRGQKGVLGQFQAEQAAKTLQKLPPEVFEQLKPALDAAGSETERALLLKAVAARQPHLMGDKGLTIEKGARMLSQGMSQEQFLTADDEYRTQRQQEAIRDIQQFAGEIRGLPRDELVRQTTTSDLESETGKGGLKQRFSTTCTITCVQMMRAESDPLYARAMHAEDGGISSKTHTGETGQQQARWLVNEADGKAVPRSKNMLQQLLLSEGAQDDKVAPVLNRHVAKYTNLTYKDVDVDNSRQARSEALDRVEASLKQGVDVVLGADWKGPLSGGHGVIAVDVRGEGKDRQFLINDPWDGSTRWIQGDDIAKGTAQLAGLPSRMNVVWLDDNKF